MSTTDSEFFVALETLAAAFPWDTVELDAKREPEGGLNFTAILPSNDKFGFPFACSWGDTPMEAVEALKARNLDRDPEKAREQKLIELKRQIEQLQAVTIGLPPYRPNRELSERVGTAQTVEIQAESVTQ